MNDQQKDVLIAAILLIVAGFSYFAGSFTNERIKNNEAINAGVAEYQVDSKTGTTRFVYLTNYHNLTNK